MQNYVHTYMLISEHNQISTDEQFRMIYIVMRNRREWEEMENYYELWSDYKPLYIDSNTNKWLGEIGD